MDSKDLTPCCGLYCPDCMWYRNDFSTLAQDLTDKLNQVDFERYASIKSPFGKELEYYQEFLNVLKFISKNHCLEPCRKGGGCGGNSCKIMECAEEKNSKVAGNVKKWNRVKNSILWNPAAVIHQKTI